MRRGTTFGGGVRGVALARPRLDAAVELEQPPPEPAEPSGVRLFVCLLAWFPVGADDGAANDEHEEAAAAPD